MSLFSPSIEKLIESFEKLPSIGHRTAARLAFHMLDLPRRRSKRFYRFYFKCKKEFKILQCLL